MADHQPTGSSQNAVFQKVAEIIYPVAMVGLLVWFLASILSSIAFTWVFHSGSVEPDWFDPLRRAATIVGQAFQHADGQVGETRLVCHHCGYQRKMPDTCPQCKSNRIRQFGTGTERVEMEVQAAFPQATTGRSPCVPS